MRTIRNSKFEIRTRAFAFAVLLVLAATLRAQPSAIHTESKADRKEITLAQSVRVTLAIEGPEPLRVELPKSLLTADANAAWRIRPDPPEKPKPAGVGRERWQQVYRLDPYAEGKPLVASFNPVTVNGQTVTWEPVPITVTKTVGDPATTPPRPPIGPEEPPPPPPPPPPDQFPAWAAVLVGLACVVVLSVALLRARKVKPVPPGEWALAQLAKLKMPGGAEAVERVAAILRTFVEQPVRDPRDEVDDG